MANKDKDKDSDIPLSQKPWDPSTMTYDQLGEFLGKTLSKLHEEEMKKIINKKKKK
tara:strand:+ start:48 stop:215 length:168 start_codon:yes stop_codon:yes gene_type:complete